MSEIASNPTPLRYEVEVQAQGHIELQVPFATGRKVIVLVLPDEPDSLADLVAAASSSLGFWDNEIDDAEWNNA
ncbi:hypothetical protein [Alkalinema sp. FACHB-956]|uniref:hypothetical protein n=1 Tax=Alkalinema sp. FACHB-956 TaxID=2692768 RepID=UPI0016863271|nr:hypothetical protein [Alkalinema sp. FACHB-956]MBD2329951.1 hypothetical protein [Alkalinema sp. FACHB-956]